MICREIWTDEWLSVEATEGIDDTVDEEVIRGIEVVIIGDGKGVVIVVGKQRQSVIVESRAGFVAVECILVDERGTDMRTIETPYFDVVTAIVFEGTWNTEVTFAFGRHNRTFNSTGKPNGTGVGSIVRTVSVEEMEKFGNGCTSTGINFTTIVGWNRTIG